jgi:hypothetical protein
MPETLREGAGLLRSAPQRRACVSTTVEDEHGMNTAAGQDFDDCREARGGPTAGYIGSSEQQLERTAGYSS